MQTVLRVLDSDIRRLRAELELYSILVEALENLYKDDSTALREYGSRARRITYSNAIVGCYGLIEQTVDSILLNVAESYSKLYATYGDLPETVKSNQRELILQCLRDGDRARVRGKVSERLAISALAKEPGDSPDIVSEVFTLSTANYRLPYVKMLFSRLGIEIESGLSKNEPIDSFNKAGYATYESFLEDFIKRRNDLAHSYGDDDIVDPDLLGAYVEIVDAYLNSVVRVANLAVIKLLARLKLVCIGTVVKNWTGRIGFEMNAGKIAVGDRLLVVKDDWCTSHIIESLQSNSEDLHHVTYDGSVIEVSAKVAVSPQSSENAKVYVLPGDWSDFWPSNQQWVAAAE